MLKLGVIVFAFVAMATVAFAATDSDMVPVQLDVQTTIAIACDPSVTMGTITGDGQSALTTNVATCNVRTNNTGGYDLDWQASTGIDAGGAMINENGDAIAAITAADSFSCLAGLHQRFRLGSSRKQRFHPIRDRHQHDSLGQH